MYQTTVHTHSAQQGAHQHGAPRTAAPEGILGQLVDTVLPGQKGFVATTFLQSFASDPAAMNAHYAANKRAIDAYFRHVDFGRVLGQTGGDPSKYIGLGILVGALGLAGWRMLTSSKPDAKTP